MGIYLVNSNSPVFHQHHVVYHKSKLLSKSMPTVSFKFLPKTREPVRQKKITITAEKGRLSEEEIERMVREAEEFAEEDKKVKEKIDARNGLESYLYNLKNTL